MLPPPRGLKSWDDLFRPHDSAPEGVTMGLESMQEALGTGLPGERFDLRCGDCGGLLRLKSGKHGHFYGCENYSPTGCQGTHGCKPDGSPIGTPGDKKTRLARIAAHRVFDKLWQPQEAGEAFTLMSREDAYLWLRRGMADSSSVFLLSKDEGRIGNFSEEQCLQLIELVKKTFPSIRTVWDFVEEPPY